MMGLPDEIILFAAAGTIVLLLLVGFIISFSLIFQNRQRQFQRERERTRESHQRELLQSQLEMQNQTLQQVGRELHDHIGQLLTVTLMRLNTLEDEMEDRALRESVSEARDLLKTVIRDVRTLSKTLDFGTVQRFGLSASLQFELDRIQRSTRVQTQLIVTEPTYAFTDQTEMVLFRMAQEALTNALKHACARNLTVTLTYGPAFQLIVADDGDGFDPKAVEERSIDEAGSGLINLYRRAQLLGGSCQIDSRPGRGTHVTIQLPQPEPNNK